MDSGQQDLHGCNDDIIEVDIVHINDRYDVIMSGIQ